ncbi:MAG: chitobiase/beta-hexosaminidase C-terminal domain-containing protein [Bacteroidaceae bacterium]|nr:chitobiase/beta-hexosaminidase C-terminal domain-containing protein [Bacteroidaceae bacterium]
MTLNKSNNILTRTAGRRPGRRILALLIMMMVGAGVSWATDYSGTYYIVSGRNDQYDANSPYTNYYLCPTENWYFYDGTNSYTTSDNGKPFLTTYRIMDGIYDVSKAAWVIEKHPEIDDCYYIKQKKTTANGKYRYMVSNGQINGSNVRRMRVHLEEVADAAALETLGDKALFEITFHEANSTCPADHLDIIPHSTDGRNDNEKYLVVNNGNFNKLNADGSKADGPNGTYGRGTGGIIGVYSTENNEMWYLEVPRPVISFDENDKVEITDPTGSATAIYYTTDDSEPTTSSTPYSAAFTPDVNVTTIKAIAIVDGKVSDVTTFISPVLPGSSRTYLIQSLGYQATAQDGFFLQPGDPDNSSNITVTTSSLARPQMQWYFKAAGKYGEYQYFYIVNNTGDYYLFCNSSGGVYMKSSSDFDSASDEYKFRILVDANDGYRIVPKAKQTVWIYKNKGNNTTDAIGTSSNSTNLECRWNFVPVFSHTMPAALRPSPFTPSNATTTAYYKIGNVNDATRFIIPGTTYATTASDAGEDDMKWFFLTPSSGASDDWLDYYYVVNAVSGKYLHFCGDDETNAFIKNAFNVQEYSSTDDDNYRFVVAKTTESANGNYYIVPKVLKDLTYTNYSLVWRDGTNALKTNKQRDNAQRKWTFTSTTYTCAQPEITWSAEGHGYVITSTESDAKIYYLVGGNDDPTINTGTLFSTAIPVADLNVASTTIRAIAARNSDGSDVSTTVASYTVYRVETPGFTLTDDGKVELTCSTEGVDFYYEMDDDNPSDPIVDSSTHYTGPIENAAGKIIKVIAVKDGMINSSIATSGTITFSCAKPVVSKTSESTFVIECSYPTSGVTIYYEMGDNPADPTVYSTGVASGTSISATFPITVKAIAVANGYNNSQMTESIISASPNYSGYYYLQNQGNTTYYLAPSSTNHPDNSNPLVQTKQNQELGSVWQIQLKENTDYYYIKHYSDGKYMIADNTALTQTVWLETTANPGDNALFEITETSSGIYNIMPVGASNEDDKNYLNVTSGNGNNHTIGLWVANENNSKWAFTKVPAMPTFTVEDINVTINNIFKNGSKIYYTTDGSDPDLENVGGDNPTKQYSSQITLEYGPSCTVKAVCVYDTPNPDWVSDIATTAVQVSLQNPVFSRAGNTLTISNNQKASNSGKVSFWYNAGVGTTPTDPVPNDDNNGSKYTGAITLTDNSLNIVKAVAYNPNISAHPNDPEYKSEVVTMIVDLRPATEITSLAGIVDPNGKYKFASNFNASGTTPSNNIGTESNPFRGTIDGNMVEFELSSPMFDYVQDATIKNVIISNANNINNANGNAGAIANNALGSTRIYNCGVLGGSISGNGNVGGIVGSLEGSSRVINCYSYVNITGGSNKGGIVGYNNYASKAGDIRTMVMNCMFYGSISGSDNISPVFGGLNINNLNGDTETGLNTYNYYRYETNKNITAGKYNCALAAKDQYLTRFELYRQLLNSNRKLAALYATGNANNGVGENNEMAKWVLDKSIAPYPILKKQGYYPSVVNYDPIKYYDDSGNEVQRSVVTERNKGKILGELTVNISAGSHGSIKTGKSQITLKRIDKDYDNFNFNYDKVQLPYFNEVGDGNYTDGMVVTGWKVTVSGGSNSFTTGSDVTYDNNGNVTSTPYNFADRNCTEKDNYDDSKRVFSQGAYFDVPYGVSEISIEAYWGKAAYICDYNYDVVYKNDFTTPQNVDVESAGEQKNSLLASGQTIYHAITGNGNALASFTGVDNPTVYDYALVLVGNLHLNAVPSGGDKPFTIMSADFDNDNEPDYSLIYSHPGRTNGAISPIRFDFINVPGTAMAQKPNSASKFLNVSIFKPKGWFEITNTCQIAIVQFEYDNGGKTAAPLILLGGEYEQIVSTQNTNLNDVNYNNRTTYIHVGSNAYFKEFNNGTHSDGWYATPHVPISATGGDYDKFYLSGAYRPDAAVAEDDAEGYISGGRFGEVAGAGQQQIDGNVYWQIYDADITDFYGGGVNSEKPITGNITVDIYNSHITTYCGGPKFGDMQKTGNTIITYATNKQGTSTATRTSAINANRIVTTNASGCTFGNFYGAGYGGISYVRKRTQDSRSYNFSNWATQYTDNKGKFFNGTTTTIGDTSNDGAGEKAGPGIAVDFDYEFFVWSTGETGGRFYIKYASLSFATTNSVTSVLNDCDITGSFYGGGRLGKVDGAINSTLNGCRVTGDVFGAGYLAERPKVPYRNGGFATNGVPSIDTNAGVFADGVKSTNIEELELNPGKTLTNNSSAISTSGKIDTDFTNDQLNALGTVSGVVTLNINNYTANNNTIQTVITGNVYGGGAMSQTTSNVNVNITGGTMTDVYGGGDQGKVGGNCTVTLTGDTEIMGNVFGGGNQADVTGSTEVNM